MTIFDSQQPNFRQAKYEADLLLLSTESIKEFPFSIKKLIREKTSLRVKDYSKAATYGVEMEDFGSPDALLQVYSASGRGIIFYNETISSNERIKYSLSHELGHFILRHDADDHDRYDIHEIEANFFAAQLLMPQQIIFELIRRGADITVPNLQKWFGVSRQAAQKRVDTLNKVNPEYRTEDEKELDQAILNKFGKTIDRIFPNHSYSNWYEEEELLQIERERWY